MKLEVWISTHSVGSKCSTIVEVPDEDLEGVTEAEREGIFEDYARDEIWNMADWGWRPKA